MVKCLPGKVVGSQLVTLPVDDLALAERVVNVNSFGVEARHVVGERVLQNILEFLLGVEPSTIIPPDLVYRGYVILMIVGNPDGIDPLDLASPRRGD